MSLVVHCDCSALNPKIHSRFLGIGLDVTDPDPLPKNHKLRQLKNIIITDHIGSVRQ